MFDTVPTQPPTRLRMKYVVFAVIGAWCTLSVLFALGWMAFRRAGGRIG